MNVRCRCGALALLLSCVIAAGVHAQDAPEPGPLPRPDDAPVRFDHLTINDGLSQMSVYGIVQDRHGFMWFGTQDGLNRYDGYTFKVYQHDPNDPASLLTGHIRTLLQDRGGMLWIGHAGSGLSRFDPGTETFTHYLHDEADPGSLSPGSIWSLLEGRDGTLWVGTTSGGLNRFDPSAGSGQAPGTETFTHLLPVPDDPGHVGNAIYSIYEDASGMLWVGTGDGLSRYDRATNTFTHHRLVPEDQSPANLVSALYEDRQGTLWVGAWGLHRFDRETEAFEHFLLDPQATEPDQFGNNRVRAIYEDDTGALWVGGTGGLATPSGGGLNRFDRATGTFTRYLHDPADPRSLISDNVWSLYQDRQGLLWVGTGGGGGMSRVDRTARLFAKYPSGSSNPNSLQGGSPRGMYLDRDDVLWIGTTGGVLNRFDRRRGVFTHFRHDLADANSLLPGQISAIHRDRLGQLWVGGGGLSRLDEETGRFTHFRHDPDDSTTLAGDGVGAIYEGREGVLWVGSGGLNRFNAEDETFTRYVHNPGDSTSIGSNAVVVLYEDQAGHLWIGVFGSGLDRFDRATGTFTHYRGEPGKAGRLSNGSVFGLYERPQEPGILWVGTDGGGLNRLDVQTGRFTHYTSQNSDLPNNTVYCVLGDEEGQLWMSTNAGIARFDPDTEAFKVFKAEDGLQMLEFDILAYHQAYNGELFFGGAGGVNAVRPGDVFDNPHPPEVALTGLRLFNEPITPGPDGPLQAGITETEAVTFAHDQNDLTLEYVGLHFRHPERNQYQYMLEGYDEAWRAVGTERRAIYTKLPPGDYTFRVKASNSDEVWNEEGTSLAITILPPWWRTWWAYALYGLLLVAGVFTADRVQRRRLLRKERERAAIEQAELRAEAAEAETRALEADNQRKKNVELLSEIGKEITASLDIDTIFGKLYEHAGQLMDADSFGVGLYHAERDEIEYRLAIEQGKRYTPYMRDATDENQFPVWCIKHRAPVFINNVAEEYSRYIDRYDDTRRTLEDGSLSEEPQSLIYLPLTAQDRVLGVITVQSFEQGAYTEHDLNMLKTLAAYTSIALDNADAYRQLGSTLEQVKSMQAQLVQQEKLASLGQVTAGIAHEIKNPLNFVNNFAELNEELAQELAKELATHKDKRIADVLDDLDDLVGSLRTNARQIHKHGKRADDIVKNMMEHAHNASGRRFSVEVNPFVEEYVGLSYHGMQARVPDLDVTIERDLDEAAGNVELAPQEMGRVLLNLLNNAFEAVHEHAAQVDGDYAPTVRVATRRVDGRVELEVSDNGPGIPETVHDKIFEPFFTTKPTGSGTGLGLSMSYEIVTQGHRGTLSMESEEGRGATFVVTLPA